MIRLFNDVIRYTDHVFYTYNLCSLRARILYTKLVSRRTWHAKAAVGDANKQGVLRAGSLLEILSCEITVVAKHSEVDRTVPKYCSH